MATIAMKKGSQTGAELLVKSLESQGVEYVFGIPGDLLQIGVSLTRRARYTIPGMGPCRNSPVGQTGL